MKTLDVRRAAPEHEEAVRALFHRAMRAGGAPNWHDDDDGYPIGEIPEDIEKGAVVGIVDGAVAAYAHYEFESPEPLDFVPWKHDTDFCYLGRLVVEPSLRNHGVGTQFIAGLIDYVKAQGAKYGRFVVYPTNTGALRLYDRLGFTKIAEYDSPWAEFDEGRIVVFETEL